MDWYILSLFKWIFKSQHWWCTATYSCWNRGWLHYCWQHAFTLKVIFPFTNLTIFKNNDANFNNIKICWRILKFYFYWFIGRQMNFIWNDFKISCVRISVFKIQFLSCWIFQSYSVACYFSKFTFKKIQMQNWIFFSNKT